MISFRRKKTDEDDSAVRDSDLFGNDSITPSQARKNETARPAYRLGYVPVGMSMRLVRAQSFLTLLALSLAIALFIREHRRVEATPLVFMQTSLGNMIPVAVSEAQPSAPYVEAFLDFVVSNLMQMENGEFTSRNRIRNLVSDDVINRFTQELAGEAGALRQTKTSMSVHVTHLDTSSPEFLALNRRYKRAFGMAYGFRVIVRGGQGYRRDRRYDFEILFVNRTKDNPWGLWLSQLYDKNPSDQPQIIPPDFRRPEDLISGADIN